MATPRPNINESHDQAPQDKPERGRSTRELSESSSGSEAAGNDNTFDTYECVRRDRLEQRVRIESDRRAQLRRRLIRVEERLDREVDHLNGELERISREFERIRTTSAWRLVQWYWQLQMRCLPFGSLRRKLYTDMITAVTRLIRFSTWKRLSETSDAQQRTIGETSNERFFLHCEAPRCDDSCAGEFLVRGTANHPAIKSIEIRLDERLIAHGNINEHDPKLIVDPLRFFFFWDTTTVQEGAHVLTISILTDTRGSEVIRVPVTVDQSTEWHRYEFWMAMNEPSNQDMTEKINAGLALAGRPTFRIVMNANHLNSTNFYTTLESIRAQIYKNWELWILQDTPSNPQTLRLLEHSTTIDSRVKLLLPNPISHSSCPPDVSLLDGEFIGFLKAGDELAPDALYEVASLLRTNPSADLIYSDEDSLDALGNRFRPFFKPNWSPDLLLSMNYISDFLVVRRELYDSVGGLRSEFKDSQQYDLVLRLIERTDRIFHIPRVLYHRRIDSSASSRRTEVVKKHDSDMQAVCAHLKQRLVKATVEDHGDDLPWRVRYEVSESPKVTLIIPTGSRIELLRTCLESVVTKTSYRPFDIIVADNSKGTSVRELLASFSKARTKIHYLDQLNRPFNFSAINNAAARETSSPLVLFLNDDTEVIEAEWLTALVEYGQRPEVGVVGAKLLYPFGLVQHAGMILGINGTSGHAFKYLPADSKAYFGLLQVVRNCSAVTAACMLTKRDLFLRLGGFNQVELGLAFQDPDYCLRVNQAGFFVVYTPYAVLLHNESASRGFSVRPAEVRYMQQKWPDLLAHDPYYNPNLTRRLEDFSVQE
jgi:O-antigen biosynthesis protein